MSVKILARRLGTNPKPCRCRAHEGQIPEGASICTCRVQIDHEPAFNVPVCRLCDHMDGPDLITAMITEARRHKAASAEPGKFTILMSREEQP